MGEAPHEQAERRRILIVGCGRTGSRVAWALWEQGHPVTVMDTEPERFLLLPRPMREEETTTFLGNPTLNDDLERAGIHEARVFVAVSSQDNLNALSALKARQTFKVPRVVCRIADPDRGRMYEEMGLIVVSPTLNTAHLVLQAILEA